MGLEYVEGVENKMKQASRILFILILSSFLCGSDLTQDKPDKILNALNFTACTSIVMDTYLTYDWIYRHHGEENSSFWRPIIHYPAIVLTLDLGTCLGITEGSKAVAKKNKFLGYLIPIVIILGESANFYNHIKVRASSRG